MRTMIDAHPDPLFGPECEEVLLERAPLVKVLWQARFAEIASISKKEFIADFQERIRKFYPLFFREETQFPATNSSGEQEIHTDVLWRFVSADGDWRVTLNTKFVVLETKKYLSRTNFSEKFGVILDALSDTIAPTHVTRLGVRYIDHIHGDELEHLNTLLCEPMNGLSNSALNCGLEYSFSEAALRVLEGKLLVKWGNLPPHTTHEPDLMETVDGKSWFLDLDVFHQPDEQSQVYDSASLQRLVLQLAARAYTVFRWMTTNEFLRIYGAKNADG